MWAFLGFGLWAQKAKERCSGAGRRVEIWDADGVGW